MWVAEGLEGHTPIHKSHILKLIARQHELREERQAGKASEAEVKKVEESAA